MDGAVASRRLFVAPGGRDALRSVRVLRDDKPGLWIPSLRSRTLVRLVYDVKDVGIHELHGRAHGEPAGDDIRVAKVVSMVFLCETAGALP